MEAPPCIRSVAARAGLATKTGGVFPLTGADGADNCRDVGDHCQNRIGAGVRGQGRQCRCAIRPAETSATAALVDNANSIQNQTGSFEPSSFRQSSACLRRGTCRAACVAESADAADFEKLKGGRLGKSACLTGNGLPSPMKPAPVGRHWMNAGRLTLPARSNET